MARVNFCQQPGCTDLAVEGSKFCAEHKGNNYQTAKNRFRREPWYDRAAWDVVRGYKLAHFPLCEDCGIVASTEVHHKDGSWRSTRDWGMFIDQENLMALCKPCHSTRTMKENQNVQPS